METTVNEEQWKFMFFKNKGYSLCEYVYIMYILSLDIWGTQEPLLLSWPRAIQTKEDLLLGDILLKSIYF